MNESILTSVKKGVGGIIEMDESFDMTIICTYGPERSGLTSTPVRVLIMMVRNPAALMRNGI